VHAHRESRATISGQRTPYNDNILNTWRSDIAIDDVMVVQGEFPSTTPTPFNDISPTPSATSSPIGTPYFSSPSLWVSPSWVTEGRCFLCSVYEPCSDKRRRRTERRRAGRYNRRSRGRTCRLTSRAARPFDHSPPDHLTQEAPLTPPARCSAFALMLCSHSLSHHHHDDNEGAHVALLPLFS